MGFNQNSTFGFGSNGDIIGGTVSAAMNGVSLVGGTTVVLGQDVGAVGNPAALISNREIPMEGFFLQFFRTDIPDMSVQIQPGVADSPAFLIESTFTGPDDNVSFITQTINNSVDNVALTIGIVGIDINLTQNSLGTSQGITIDVTGGSSPKGIVINTTADIDTPPTGIEVTTYNSAIGGSNNVTGLMLTSVTDGDGIAYGINSVAQTNGTNDAIAILLTANAFGTGRAQGLAVSVDSTSSTAIGLTVFASTGGGAAPGYAAIFESGFVGVNISTPTARLHIAAQTSTAGTAPLKLASSATLLGTAETGAFEYNGTNLFFTRTGTTRETIITASAVTSEALASNRTITINFNGTTYKLLATTV